MSTPDPFSAFESERTVIKPKPRSGSPAPTAGPPSDGPPPDTAPSDMARIEMLNPLVSAAGPLLGLAARLRGMAHVADPASLRASTTQAIQRFESDARKSGSSNETVLAARYVLCTAIDEAVANTPWGVRSGWNKQSLLVQFHNETWGGEKVFQLLAKLAQDVPANRSLLELIYCVLALGFEGRYRVIENGRSQLETLRQRLADLIRKDRPTLEAELSPHWRGHTGEIKRLRDVLPLWVYATALLLLLAFAWLAFRLSLNSHSDGVYSSIASLRVPQAPAATPPPAKVPRLARFLEPEIREGLVTVTDEADRSIVRLRGDSFFASGSAEPMEKSLPVLKRIGDALAEVKGDVLITGHSDNQPIRSLRFPSNWHLSAARAEGVKTALLAQVEARRMRTEGRADSEPLAPNDTPANRAQNRRVEITLMTGPTGAMGVTGAAPGNAVPKGSER